MDERERQAIIPTEDVMRRSLMTTVICDVVLIAFLVLFLLIYTSRNNIISYNQNVHNITSITTAESELLQAALDNTGHEVKSAFSYCQGKSAEQMMDYLSTISIADDEYQLLKRDEDVSDELYHVYTGYSTRKSEGGYQQVIYKDTALADSIYSYSGLPDGELSFSQSFTNKTDALRYYAVFCGVTVDEGGASQRYYLVKPQKESKLLNQLQMVSQYSEAALAVCYADGKYLARDDGFRSDNFYDYLYKYNDLSLDQMDAIRSAVQNDEDGSGFLKYKDYKGRDCVFAYADCGDTQRWNVIVSVPQSEFVEGKLLSFFPLIIIIFLVILLAFNVWRLLVIVKELRSSVERERIANASKSSFLSRMSHEIRTPLNAVIGYNVIAKKEMNEAGSDEERRQAGMKVMDCLDKSEIASKHLLTIINDVLDMSAIESGRIKVDHERFDFRGLITSLTTVFYSQSRAKGVDFEVIFDNLTEEWFVGDQMRTNQILTNLLSNAVKFTPEGGSVTLKIHQPEPEANAAHIHFEVTDTGIGMTPDYIKHIWTPFEQEDSSISRRFGGTGLGLSITKNLVDLMGGSITVESVHGKGTSFGVDLKFERAEQPQSGEVYDFSSVNALIVDDDESTCDYIKLLFSRCGARCSSVTSGDDALEAFSVAEKNGERYSVCLVDWRMPGMDGIETVRRMKDISGNDMPIIVLTAYDYTEIADEAAEVGVSKFITKPLFQSSLFDLLANQSGVHSQSSISKNEDMDFHGAHILLAENNAMNMEIAKAILGSAGFIVDGAWNGQEAVELFESSPGYAAILMDVHMPVMDGHDAARAIRASSRPDAGTIPIIAMTADAFAENVAEARAAGMNDHIPKPIDIPVLFETLSKYIV